MRFDWFPSLRKFWSLLLLWWVSRVRLNKNKNLNDFNDFQKVVSSSNLKTMLRLDKRSIWLELEFVLLLKYWHYYDIMIFDIAEMQCQCQYFNNNVSIVVELFTLLHSMLRCNASVNISTTMPVLLLKYLHYYIQCWETMPVTNNWMIRGIDRLKGSLRMFLDGPSQDVFLLPHIPWEGSGVVYLLYINLWSYLS